MPPAVTHTMNDYESLLVALQNVLGVVVPEGQRSNLLERVEPLLIEYKFDSLSMLAKSLQSDQSGAVKSKVLEAISQRQTSWCLSPDTTKVLHDYIFEQLPENARIWVVGCGQGQLAYAVAMEFAEYANKASDSKEVQIFATDGSAINIEQARSASYTENQLTSLSTEYKKLYISKMSDSDNYELKSRVKEFVSFEQCNLTENFESLGEMDLIICPDALVYFSNGVKESILRQFSSLLKSGGIFLTGSNQTMVPVSDGFERVNHSSGVFYRQKK